jgi:hypothetical protein
MVRAAEDSLAFRTARELAFRQHRLGGQP